MLGVVLGAIAAWGIGGSRHGPDPTWVSGFPFSFNWILGTAGLIGVALSDSIVVLAAIRADARACGGDEGAVADAVLGCTRHVLSTTLTTIGGFLPLLLFVGGDFWPPLAIVLSGGVVGATLLATLFVPASYVWLQRTAPMRATTLAVSVGASRGSPRHDARTRRAVPRPL